MVGKVLTRHTRCRTALPIRQPAFLRHVLPIGEQLRHHFEPGDDVGGQLPAQERDFLQHAVKAKADFEHIVRRLEMDVAGGDAHRLGVRRHVQWFLAVPVLAIALSYAAYVLTITHEVFGFSVSKLAARAGDRVQRAVF